MDDKFNNVLVTVTNSTFPLIDTLSNEERQARAEKDELSTVELPLFILDNLSTTKKVAEWTRVEKHPLTKLAVKRTDYRVEAAVSYDRTKAAILINSGELEQLHLSGPEYVYSMSDCKDDKNLRGLALKDILQAIRIKRSDGLPVNKVAQEEINVFTFHFLRKR